MKKIVATLAALGCLCAVTPASAGPEEDRLAMVEHYKKQFPSIPSDEFIFGALAFDKDAKSQYNAIMEFPPYTSEMDKAEKMWKTPMKSGKTYADCLPNGGKMIAGNYPVFDEAKGKVVTLEEVVNQCRKANGEEPWKLGDAKTMGLFTAYLRTLSDGMKMNIKVSSPAALKAYEDGKRTFFTRKGQLNMSCANCHIDNAGVRIRSEILSPIIGQATHWPVFRAGENLVTLQTRYKGCHGSIRHVGDDVGSERYNNLEYFHSYMSNGMEMRSAVFRK